MRGKKWENTLQLFLSSVKTSGLLSYKSFVSTRSHYWQNLTFNYFSKKWYFASYHLNVTFISLAVTRSLWKSNNYHQHSPMIFIHSWKCNEIKNNAIMLLVKKHEWYLCFASLLLWHINLKILVQCLLDTWKQKGDGNHITYFLFLPFWRHSVNSTQESKSCPLHLLQYLLLLDNPTWFPDTTNPWISAESQCKISDLS